MPLSGRNSYNVFVLETRNKVSVVLSMELEPMVPRAVIISVTNGDSERMEIT